MQTRRLGRTDHDSSIAILSGAAFAMDSSEEAEGLLHEALDAGVNHLDVAPGYGSAERALGPHLKAIRQRLFLACKTAETERDWALRRLDRSLKRLQVDKLDLYQAHGVTSLEVLDQRDEAFEVILEARHRGLTKFVGVTGHDLGAPRAHLEAIRRYDLDTVMFPVYPAVWADTGYRADVDALLAECAERDVGVMAIKAVAWRPWDAGTRRCSIGWRPLASGSSGRSSRTANPQKNPPTSCQWTVLTSPPTGLAERTPRRGDGNWISYSPQNR